MLFRTSRCARALALVALTLIPSLLVAPRQSSAGDRAGASADASPAPAVTTDDTRIAFTAQRDGGKSDIHVMHADGRAARNVTQDDALELAPAWSRDGKLLAYTRGRAGGIWFVRPDGKEKRQFDPDGFSPAFSPAFSPVEDRIAYVTHEGLWVSRFDGRAKDRLTDSLARVRRDRNPSWSPDGTRIAFYEEVDRKCAIFVVDVASKVVTRITDAKSSNHTPAWSPDGKRIAFVSSRKSNDEIYVMQADGSEPKRLTRNPGIDTRPCWSPDGKRIAFQSQRGDVYGVHVMDADGKHVHLLSDPAVKACNPSWGPAARARTDLAGNGK